MASLAALAFGGCSYSWEFDATAGDASVGGGSGTGGSGGTDGSSGGSGGSFGGSGGDAATCVCKPPPKGWTFARLAEGSEYLGCPEDVPAQAQHGSGAAPWSCDACQCQVTATCALAVTTYEAAGCAGPALSTTPLPQLGCPAFSGSPDSFQLTQQVEGSPCAASSKPSDAKFATKVTVCAMLQESLCPNDPCATLPGFSPKQCVVPTSASTDAGADAAPGCPPEFPDAHVYSVSLDDQRSCECTCDLSSPACENAMVLSPCGTTGVPVAVDGSCHPVLGPWLEVKSLPTVKAAGCTVTAPVPKGTLTPAGAALVCCKP